MYSLKSKLCVFVVSMSASHQGVAAGVMQQPSFPQDSSCSPLAVVHCLHQSHQRDVGAETRAGTGDGAEDRSKEMKH